MKLEKQVCNKDLSKLLRESKVKQKSLWYWEKHKKDEERDWQLKEKTPDGWTFDYENFIRCSAFTVAELGEMIKGYGMICYNDLENNWKISYGSCFIGYADTEANARARLLIYLKENKLLEVKK